MRERENEIRDVAESLRQLPYLCFMAKSLDGKTELLVENQRVTIHSFGDGKSGTGKIRGLAMDYITQIYIVEIDQPSPWEHDYTCINVPRGCITIIPENQFK